MEAREWPDHAMNGQVAACRRRVDLDAQQRLQRSAYLELRSVNCSFNGKVLVLRGLVSSYYVRQLATACVKGLEGVEAIDNLLEVVSWHGRRAN